jgi:hydrogenase nickel incorporation protein HypA/HybF
MHELSIVASLFEILEEKSREQRAQKIVLVKLKIGKLSGVVSEFLQTAFDAYKRETLASEAILEIEEIPLRIKCQTCQAEFIREDFIFICPLCKSTELKILSGTELFLEKIELLRD